MSNLEVREQWTESVLAALLALFSLAEPMSTE